MLFTQPVFLLLILPIACAAFYTVTPRFGPSVGFGVLLVISLLFYLPWGWFYFSLLIASITANFLAAYVLLAFPDDRKALRSAAFALGLVYNFGTLAWFKYRFFFSHIVGGGIPLLNAAIPVGISFYTFQQAIFLVDARNRDHSVVAYMGDMRTWWGKLRGYVHHAFFVAFFPHVVIGPIVYLREFQPQIEIPTFGRLKMANLEVGLSLIIIGMFKKIVLADHIGLIVDPIFGTVDSHLHVGMGAAWLGAISYYAQLYFDFSGYTDMALGTARSLGIRFPMNFYSPLKAIGIIDFYRRWHITLTRVIARFIYTPMSIAGARFAVGRRWSRGATRVAAQWVPLILNFEIIALWHGARVTFILFGVIHGVWYVVETELRASRRFKRFRKKAPDWLRGLGGRLIFTFVMVICFGLFRSTSIESFGLLLTQMFSGTLAVPPQLRPSLFNLGWLVFALGCMWLLPNSMELLRYYRVGIPTYDNKMYGPKIFQFAWRPNWKWTALLVVMCLTCLRYIAMQPPFLYMGF